jgi:hypothetical protein
MTRARSLGLVWPYLLAIALGYLLGSIALPALSALAGGNTSTPFARVGFALREKPSAPSAAWAVLDADLQVVRSSLAAPQRDVFDLVVAVRGLDGGGTSDWKRAENICNAQSWPRCDKEALAQLKELSRP